MTTLTETDKDKLLLQAKEALYRAYTIMACVKIENDYQEKAFKSVLDAYHAIAKATT